MVPTVDRAKATVIVKIRFVERDPRVLPEMSAKVAFLRSAASPRPRESRCSPCSQAAIVERDGVKSFSS